MSPAIEQHVERHNQGRVSTHELCLGILSMLSPSHYHTDLMGLPDDVIDELRTFLNRGFGPNCRSTSRYKPTAEQFHAIAEHMKFIATVNPAPVQ